MEGDQDIPEPGDANTNPLVTLLGEQYPAEETEMELDPPVNSVEFEEMLSEAPKHKVEVLIEKKLELDLDDLILPDHYYDDGNIPVFKPVIPHVHELQTNTLIDNGSVFKF